MAILPIIQWCLSSGSLPPPSFRFFTFFVPQLFCLPDRLMVGKQVLAGLSDVQLKFINSAGPEERDRLLLQVWYCATKKRYAPTRVDIYTWYTWHIYIYSSILNVPA